MKIRRHLRLLSLTLTAALSLTACRQVKETGSSAYTAEEADSAVTTLTTVATSENDEAATVITDINGFPESADSSEQAVLKGHIFSANEAQKKISMNDATAESKLAANDDDNDNLTATGKLSAFEKAKAASSGISAKYGDSLAKYTNEQQAKLDAFFGPLPLISQLSLQRHYKARAIYINNGANLANNISLISNSELNAVVINIKSDSYFHYATKNKIARRSRVMIENNDDLSNKIAKLKAANIRVIGKISCFRDTLLARNHPEFAIKDKNGTVINWSSEGESSFLNPYNMNVWRYLRDVVYEAIDLGCDEILLDQVRFPFGVPLNEAGKAYYGEADVIPDKVATISRFLEFMRVEISDKLGIALSASMYDIQDETSSAVSGQSYTTFSTVGLDSITPNLFPADYASDSTWMGNGVGTELNGVLFKAPDLEPYNVISATLNQYINRYKQDSKSFYRPYLQAFTAYYLPAKYRQEYKAEQIAAEIQALRDNGVDEYILWNSEANYDPEIFNKLTSNAEEAD